MGDQRRRAVAGDFAVGAPKQRPSGPLAIEVVLATVSQEVKKSARQWQKSTASSTGTGSAGAGLEKATHDLRDAVSRLVNDDYPNQEALSGAMRHLRDLVYAREVASYREDNVIELSSSEEEQDAGPVHPGSPAPSLSFADGKVVPWTQVAAAAAVFVPADGLHSTSDSATLKQFRINDIPQSRVKEQIYACEGVRPRIQRHQLKAIRFIFSRFFGLDGDGQGGFIAHCMGRGKTMTAIATMLAASSAFACKSSGYIGSVKLVVVCPKALVDNWVEEVRKWAPIDPGGESDNFELLGRLFAVTQTVQAHHLVLEDMIQRWAAKETGNALLIISYPQLIRLGKTPGELSTIIQDVAWMVVADEAHEIGSPNTDSNHSMSLFSTPFKVGLTGTPMTNELKQLFHLVEWLTPPSKRSDKIWAKFWNQLKPVQLYNYGGVEPDLRAQAVKAAAELTRFVSTHMDLTTFSLLERLLPPKTEYVIRVTLTREECEWYNGFMEVVSSPPQPGHQPERSRSNQENEPPKRLFFVKTFDLIGPLRLLLAHPQLYISDMEKRAKERQPTGPYQYGTMDHLESSRVAVLRSILRASAELGDKVLVFTQRRAIQDLIVRISKQEKHKTFQTHGDIPDRQEVVRQFSDEKGPAVLVISTKAGGMGLNMQVANRVVMFDYGYVPAEENQAIARAWRFGQEKPVSVYWLATANSLDDSVWNRARFKEDLSQQVMRGTHLDPQAQTDMNIFAEASVARQDDSLRDFTADDSVLVSVVHDKLLRGRIVQVEKQLGLYKSQVAMYGIGSSEGKAILVRDEADDVIMLDI